MAVTVITEPSAYMPVYNPHWWLASSTQTAQPNFTYEVTFSDIITGDSITKNYAARPSDGKVIINSATFAEPYVVQINPDALYGFQLNTGAIRKIRVNIGERYDVAGTSTFFNGTNKDYIVWNGSLLFLTMESYTYTNYLWAKYLTNNVNPSWPTTGNYSYDEKTFEGKSNYLSSIGVNTSDFSLLNINGYDANGAFLNQTIVRNPYDPGADYKNGYVFIDVGYRGLLNMPFAQVVGGTWPIPVSTYAYYEIEDDSPGLINPIIIKRIYTDCEPRFDVISLHYLARKGQFESFHFSKLSERTSEVQTTTYSKYPYVLSGNNIVYDYGVNVKVTLSVTESNRIKVNTDWLTEEEVVRFKELASSPLVYAHIDSYYTAMNRVPGSFREEKKYNSKLLSVSFDLEYSHTNNSQRG